MKFVYYLPFLILANCSHSQNSFEDKLIHSQCDEAFLNLPEVQPINKTVETTAWLAKNTAAYTYVGLNYTAEILWDASVGVMGVVVLCMPVMAATAYAARAGGNGYPVVGCLPQPDGYKGLFSPPLGRNAIKDTQDFRCPNVDGLAHSLEKVAVCYKQKGDKDKARQTYNNIKKSKHFFSCLEPKYQQQIQQELKNLDEQI